MPPNATWDVHKAKLPALYATPEASSPNHTQPPPPIPLARRGIPQLRDETDMTSSVPERSQKSVSWQCIRCLARHLFAKLPRRLRRRHPRSTYGNYITLVDHIRWASICVIDLALSCLLRCAPSFPFLRPYPLPLTDQRKIWAFGTIVRNCWR